MSAPSRDDGDSNDSSQVVTNAMASSSRLPSELFDYELPSELIAQRPARQGDSRLLLLPREGDLEHRGFRDLPSLLEPGDLLVYNDTKVIRARLYGNKLLGESAGQPGGQHDPPTRGAEVEVLLIERLAERRWSALVRPGRRFRNGGRIVLHAGSGDRGEDSPVAQVRRVADSEAFQLTFDRPISPLLAKYGHLPLPPYIERPADERDEHEYQTIFAAQPGAVAAPTAGLHFTPGILEALEARGIRRCAVTLHVGPGTFRPLSSEDALDHSMHEEWYEVPTPTARAIRETRERGCSVVAVGTTVVRTLEAAALVAGTDEPGELIASGCGSTDLYITPGFDFRIVDKLITNFHLPRSTLLVLVSAFSGIEPIRTAYEQAIAERYRFFSYGDAMLLERRR